MNRCTDLLERYKLLEMARNREQYKDDSIQRLVGGLHEYLKHTIAKELYAKNKIDSLKWVDHWETEYKSLIDVQLRAVLLADINNFKNRKLAFKEALTYFDTQIKRIITGAKNQIKRDFGLQRLYKVDTNSKIEAFKDMVYKVAKDTINYKP